MVNTSATSLPIPQGGAEGRAQLVLDRNSSLSDGMPGAELTSQFPRPNQPPSPPPGTASPSPANSSGSKVNSWADYFASQFNYPVSGPPTPEASIKLARDLILLGDPSLFPLTNRTLPYIELDMAAVQGLFVLPSAVGAHASNIPTTNTSPPATLTFSNLTLVNLPPGPASTYPLGMSVVMMWSVDMERWGMCSPSAVVTPLPCREGAAINRLVAQP
jgi:hypothetical protein